MNLNLDIDRMPAALRENDALRFEYHVHVDWTPHIPCVDEQLIVTARDQYAGALTTEAFDRAGCGFRGTNGREGERCGREYAAHTCRTILAVRLKRSVRESEIDAFVEPARAWMRENNVDGVAVLESPDGHEVTNESSELKGDRGA